MGSEDGGVAPGQVGSAGLSTGVPAVLFRESTISRGVFGDDGDEAIGEVLDGTEEGGVGCRSGGVSASIDIGNELAEEGKGDRSDSNFLFRSPDDNSVVELLGDDRGCEVPWLKAEPNQ